MSLYIDRVEVLFPSFTEVLGLTVNNMRYGHQEIRLLDP